MILGERAGLNFHVAYPRVNKIRTLKVPGRFAATLRTPSHVYWATK